MSPDRLSRRIAMLDAECADLFARLREVLGADDRATFTKLARLHRQKLAQLKTLQQLLHARPRAGGVAPPR